MKKLESLINQAHYNNEYSKKIIENKHIFDSILKACNGNWEKGCGSYLFDGANYEYNIEMYNKQKLLYDKTKNIKNVLEIGTYMGHSLLIMLISNPFLEVTCIDINEKYTKPSLEVLKNHFPDAKIEFLLGDSLILMPTIKNKYEMFHIDGSHSDFYVEKEFAFCKKISRNKIMKIFIDDAESCKNTIETIINNNVITEYIVPNSAWSNCYLEINL